MLDADLRKLDTDLHMFTAFAYVGYDFCICWIRLLRTLDTAFAYVGYGFCARCADFAYIYGFGIHVVGLVREILSRWSNITVHHTDLVAI